MKRFENLTLWLVILGLIVFSAIASVAWLSFAGGDGDSDALGGLLPEVELPFLGGPSPEGESELVTIDLGDYLLGEALVTLPVISELDGQQIHPLLLTAILAAVFIGGLFVMGLPVALIYVRLDRQATEVKADPEYQEALSELEKRERAQLDGLGERQEGGGRPDEVSQPSNWGTLLYALLFVFSLGFALGDTLFPDGEVELVGLMLDPVIVVPLVLAAVIFLIFFLLQYRPRTATVRAEAESEEGIPWGTIWVILSGLVFLGIGTGLMFAIRNMGG